MTLPLSGKRSRHASAGSQGQFDCACQEYRPWREVDRAGIEDGLDRAAVGAAHDGIDDAVATVPPNGSSRA